jgi:hypothetical protein
MALKTTEYCLERAAECERLAAAAELPETRDLLLELAVRWRAGAERDEPTLQQREGETEEAAGDVSPARSAGRTPF